MINTEKLLGKLLSGAVQSGVKNKIGVKNDNFIGSLLGGLASEKGLMTAIGLGVGAYEIYQSKQGKDAGSGAPPVPPPVSTGATSAPPPLPGENDSMPPDLPVKGQAGEEAAPTPAGDIAALCIRTMIAAAHADGELDQEEENRIFGSLEKLGLTEDEEKFVMDELHAPQSIEKLTAGVTDPAVAQVMYNMALSVIVVDSVEERQWLDELAASLNISETIQEFLEDQA